MNIQIRENKNNNIINVDKVVEVNITDVGEYDNLETSLGFETISSPEGAGDILHSNDAEGDRYLGYGDTTTPELTITLPTEGVYSIKIVARNIVTSNGDVSTSHMSANGDIITSTTIGPVPVITYIKSNVIDLEYNTSDNDWV
jgi:hypothetical protein